MYDGLRPSLREHVELIDGFFNTSLTSHTMRQRLRRGDFRPAMYIEIDVDLYAAAKEALRWVFANALVVPGVTLIYYDEWGQGGEASAHHEIAREFGVEFALEGSLKVFGVDGFNRLYRVVRWERSQEYSPLAGIRRSRLGT